MKILCSLNSMCKGIKQTHCCIECKDFKECKNSCLYGVSWGVTKKEILNNCLAAIKSE